MAAQHLGDLLADGVDRVERGHRLLEDDGDLLGADVGSCPAAAAAPGRGPARGSGRRRCGRAASAISFRTESAVTVLPQPDSPTTPTVSPRCDGEVDAVDRVHHAVVGREMGLEPADLEQRLGHHITRRGSSASRSPSPMKLMESTVRKIAAPGKQRPVRRDVEVVLGVEQDAAPGRDVGREAEAEEGQRRFGDDGGGDVDGAGDDHRAERVGQDVAHDLARLAWRRARAPPRRTPSRAATGTARAPAAPPASSASRRSRPRSG